MRVNDKTDGCRDCGVDPGQLCLPFDHQLLAELQTWLPAVRSVKRTHGSFGFHGFNETWLRGAKAMATRHLVTSNDWLRHVRKVDEDNNTNINTQKEGN